MWEDSLLHRCTYIQLDTKQRWAAYGTTIDILSPYLSVWYKDKVYNIVNGLHNVWIDIIPLENRKHTTEYYMWNKTETIIEL